VTPSETASLMRFVDMARTDSHSTEQGLQLAIQAILVSPKFLFRIERDANPTDPSQIHPVSDIELASRLSYFLWSSMPDESLLQLAESGKLHEAETLRREITRMLADPRSAALASNFAGQWLETRNLDVAEPDPKKFPDAVKYDQITFVDALRQRLNVMDSTAFSLCLDNNVPILVFDLGDEHAIRKAVLGEKIGTLVTN